MIINTWIGFVLSFIISYIAHRRKSLSLSGFFSATMVGTLFYMFGSYVVWSILIFFFLSSSVISKLSTEEAKLGGRNYIQVLSNAAVSLAFLTLFYILKDITFLLVAVVAIAATTADTWASEIGRISKGKTYSILTFKPMEKGLSGAISLVGILASLMGAFVIGIIFITLYFIEHTFSFKLAIEWLSIITISGFIGSILDSYLGVLLQAKYKDLKSGKIAEIITNTEQFILISGKKMITNNAVNFIMVLTISLATYIFLVM